MIRTLKHFAAALLVIAVVLCASAGAQTSRSATQPTTRSRAAEISKRLVGPSDGKRINTGPQNPWAQWARTLGALALVVVLIFAARIMLKRFGPVSGRQRRDMLDVLARAAVSPRHQMLLVRVGRRVVLVGQSPASMTALSEVTDPDEVAALIDAASSGAGLKHAADIAGRSGGKA
jgi:flagellar protein FliO/FliZ